MGTTRKIRFGVAVNSEITSAKACVEIARKAEGLGYSTMLFADHMSRSSAPLVISMAALSATTSLRVGTQVLANPFRNPSILAKEIASLDMLSDGRFEPGIGAGWPSTSRTGRSDSDQTGIDMRDRIGIDRITFETDYPHSDSTWPESREVAARLLQGLDQESIVRILRTNAIELFELREFS